MGTVQRLSPADFTILSNPGITSEQIAWQQNAPPTLRVTITRVMMEPGATSQRHSHPELEQTWIVEQGARRYCWSMERRKRSGRVMSCARLRAKFTV